MADKPSRADEPVTAMCRTVLTAALYSFSWQVADLSDLTREAVGCAAPATSLCGRPSCSTAQVPFCYLAIRC
jgi:hypothetical protein